MGSGSGSSPANTQLAVGAATRGPQSWVWCEYGPYWGRWHTGSLWGTIHQQTCYCIISVLQAWVWSYRQWLEKNRPGSTRLGEAGLTALGDLSDLGDSASHRIGLMLVLAGQYVNCGELTKGSAMCAGCERPLNGSGPFRIAEGRLWHPEHVDCR